MTGTFMKQTIFYLYLPPPFYIAPRPEFDENEEEIFPEYAIENNMDYPIMPELVADAVINALNQKRDATEKELLKALNYYLDADTFYQVMNRAKSIIVCRILRSHQRTG